MYIFTPYIKYKTGGEIKSSDKTVTDDYSINLTVDDNSVKAVMTSDKEIELIDFCLKTERRFPDNEVFFVNGFQSWSTSPEVRNNETLKGAIGLSNMSSFTSHLAKMSGDGLFTEYGVKGKFHSFTYTYFRKNNNIELFGSMNEKTGYTIFEIDADKSDFTIRKDVLGEVFTGESELLDVVIIDKEYNHAFDDYFGSMNLRRPKVKHLSGYTSWYNYFQNINEEIIYRDLDGLDRVKDSVNIFQIDDGYETYVGDWLDVDPKKFPKGMKAACERIHGKGYLAGIWIAPFSCQKKSKVAKEHPDWLVKNENGKPMYGAFAWGGAYILDIYNEEVRAYIKNFFDVILNDWGYDMVKLDFLYSEAIFPRNGKSRGRIMCEAMEFLRECVGDEKLILGCGVPLGPSFGIVDACRISCDVDLVYDGKFYDRLNVNREVPSAQKSMNNSIFRRHLNQRVFCNDPDVFFLRRNNLDFTDEQKYILGKVNNLCGDILFVSDNVGDYYEKDLELVKEFFAENNAVIVSAGFDENRVMTIAYMIDEKEYTFSFNMKKGVIVK